MSRAPNPFTRADTLTGACQAVADDFGFNPLYLRILFGVGLFVSLKWTALVYLALAVTVLASRLLFSDQVERDTALTPAQEAPAVEAEEPMRLAA